MLYETDQTNMYNDKINSFIHSFEKYLYFDQGTHFFCCDENVSCFLSTKLSKIFTIDKNDRTISFCQFITIMLHSTNLNCWFIKINQLLFLMFLQKYICLNVLEKSVIYFLQLYG